MPRCWLLRMIALAAIFSTCAVANSWMFIRKEPSPSISITSLSGWATLTPSAAGYPKPIAPNPALVMNWRELVLIPLARPHLVLAHARGDVRIALGQLVEHLDHHLRQNDLILLPPEVVLHVIA